jgi:hypothetical protein
VSVKCVNCNSDNTDTAKFCSECAVPLQPLEDIGVTKTIETPKEELTTGSTFAGRYQIIEELGKGGMGKVYKVHDTKIKEKMALKLIKPEIARDKKTIERFILATEDRFRLGLFLSGGIHIRKKQPVVNEAVFATHRQQATRKVLDWLDRYLGRVF